MTTKFSIKFVELKTKIDVILVVMLFINLESHLMDINPLLLNFIRLQTLNPKDLEPN